MGTRSATATRPLGKKSSKDLIRLPTVSFRRKHSVPPTTATPATVGSIPSLAPGESAGLSLQRKLGNDIIGGEGGVVSPTVARRIHQARVTGSPLDPALQSRMETSFATDFSEVRVHTDLEAQRLNRQLTARAFTAGDHIFLGRGASAGDRRTMAHELTHVVQQRSMNRGGAMTVGPAGDAYERQADAVADGIAVNEAPLPAGAGPVVQRDPGSDDYNQGYQDGKNGQDANPVPRDGDALTDYNEGYAKGHNEFSQQTQSAGPPGPNASEGPAATPSSPQSDQGSGPVTIPETTIVGDPTAGNAYNLGYQDGQAGSPAHRDQFTRIPVDPKYLADYDQGYSDGQKRANAPTTPLSGDSIGPAKDEIPEGEKPEGFDEQSSLGRPEYGRYVYLKNKIADAQRFITMGGTPRRVLDPGERTEYERLFDIFSPLDPDPVPVPSSSGLPEDEPELIPEPEEAE